MLILDLDIVDGVIACIEVLCPNDEKTRSEISRIGSGRMQQVKQTRIYDHYKETRNSVTSNNGGVVVPLLYDAATSVVHNTVGS